MKRILILNYEFPPLGGGGGVAAYKLAKGFIENGYEVDYLTTWYKGLKRFEIVDGINVYRVNVLGRKDLQTATMISLLSFPLMAFWQGVKLCKIHEYEFINTHFVVPTGPLGFILAKLFKVKNILSLHGGDIYDPTKNSSPHKFRLLKYIIRFLLERADCVVAQSSNTKKNTVDYYSPQTDIQIIPLAYDPYEFTKLSRKELGLLDDKKYLIGVGRLVKRKDFATFIKTLPLLGTNVDGIIVGDGPEKENLETLAKKLGVYDRVHFVGQVDENKKFQYLANSDVFILSSIHEGFGIVLQEAMQVGLPIIATNNGGQVDLIEQSINGYLVNVGDSVGIANATYKIVNNKKNNQSDLIKKFNCKNVAKEYMSATKNNSIVSKSFFDLQRETYKDLALKFDIEQKRDNRNHLNKIKAINSFLDISNGDKVLEIGIGTGIHAKYLLDFNKDKAFEMTGVDISEDMINEAKKKLGKDFLTYCMIGEDLKFDDCSFDKVFISGSLHHFNDPEKGIKELLRVLKKGGRFAIMEPNILFPTNFIAANTIPAEINMRYMKKSNFKKWLSKERGINYDIVNFAYTPPFPKFMLPVFDLLDKIIFHTPIINNFSVMLFIKGNKYE